MVGTTRDPATPYSQAVALANELDSGVLITRNGDGHTGYGRGNTCVDSAVDRYLVQPAPPPNRRADLLSRAREAGSPGGVALGAMSNFESDVEIDDVASPDEQLRADP